MINRLLFFLLAGVPGLGFAQEQAFPDEGRADAERERIAKRISSIGSDAWFGLRDDANRSMDCLQVVQREGDRLLGLYHNRQRGRFSLHLAESGNFSDWRHLRELDSHASQGELNVLPDGSILLAYEKDAPDSCWIRLRHYADEAALLAGKWESERDLTRSLAPTAEGTPSIEAAAISARSLNDADIRLRFHYFEDAKADRLASGRLEPGGKWQTQREVEISNSFIDNGFRGNIGDRTRFHIRGRPWYLQEAQRTFGDWTSWRIVLCGADGRFGSLLPLRSAEGSKSFCNPNVAAVRFNGRGMLAVSLFLPSEGNAHHEAGQLLYLVDMDGL